MHILLAVFAVPHILFVENFALLEFFQTVHKLNSFSLIMFSFFLAIYACERNGSSKIGEKNFNWLDVLVPDDSYLEFFAFSHVIFKQRFVGTQLQFFKNLLDLEIIGIGHRAPMALAAVTILTVLVPACDVLEENSIRLFFYIPGVRIILNLRVFDDAAHAHL